jgi:uncharacterized Ntn-hydrolase superfamily protein
MLEEGLSTPEILQELLANDVRTEIRQVALVDSKGRIAAHTGKECVDWAWHVTWQVIATEPSWPFSVCRQVAS